MTVFLNLNGPFNLCGCITWKAQVQPRSQGPVLLGPRGTKRRGGPWERVCHSAFNIVCHKH